MDALFPELRHAGKLLRASYTSFSTEISARECTEIEFSAEIIKAKHSLVRGLFSGVGFFCTTY